MNLDACSCTELQLLKEYLTWLHHYGVDSHKGKQRIALTLEQKGGNGLSRSHVSSP
jgi:hypothetical protein